MLNISRYLTDSWGLNSGQCKALYLKNYAIPDIGANVEISVVMPSKKNGETL